VVIFDIRNMKELCIFRGAKKEATTVAWHPLHESLIASAGTDGHNDGSINFWDTK